MVSVGIFTIFKPAFRPVGNLRLVSRRTVVQSTCTKIGCGPLFGSECFAHPVAPNHAKMVLRCLKDYFGSLLSRYQGHTSQVSWIAAGLRALRPCRNKPEQTGWHKFFFSPSGAQTLLMSPGDHLSGTDCAEEWLASRTCTKIGCGPLFGSEGFAKA